MDIAKLKRRFNHTRKFGKGKHRKKYFQIAHEKQKSSAKKIAREAKKQNYHYRVFEHPLKEEKHFDVYVRKKGR